MQKSTSPDLGPLVHTIYSAMLTGHFQKNGTGACGFGTKSPGTGRNVFSKIRLLTGTYIPQENRHKVNVCCPLCGTGAEDCIHFLAVCLRLAESRQDFICELVSILSVTNSEYNVRSLIKDPQYLTQFILDCSVTVDRIENWSRNVCFVLHQKRSEILGLSIRK